MTSNVRINVIDSLNFNKAPGRDQFSTFVLKKLSKQRHCLSVDADKNACICLQYLHLEDGENDSLTRETSRGSQILPTHFSLYLSSRENL